MIQIKLSGVEETIEHTVSISFKMPFTNFQIDNEDLPIDTKKLVEVLSDYERKRSADVPFIKREYFNFFKKFQNNLCIVNMLRAFACSNGYLSFWYADFDNENLLKQKIEIARENFSNRLLIDWTEKEEPQPQMYFIHKDLLKADVSGLYKLQLLQKYSISYADETEEFMYVPFEYPNVNNLQIIGKYLTWRKIVKGINEEVKRLVNNWRTTL